MNVIRCDFMLSSNWNNLTKPTEDKESYDNDKSLRESIYFIIIFLVFFFVELAIVYSFPFLLK